jgi:hypothetical protein
VLPAVSRADRIDDFKAAVASQLPIGSPQARVIAFLNARNFYGGPPEQDDRSGMIAYRRGMRGIFKANPTERTITIGMEKKRTLFSETTVDTVFEFDAEGLLKDVRYIVSTGRSLPKLWKTKNDRE